MPPGMGKTVNEIFGKVRLRGSFGAAPGATSGNDSLWLKTNH